MQTHQVFISLGSNQGDRQALLEQAQEKIQQTEGLEIKEKSKYLDNPPLLYTKQANFLNQIIKIQCSLSAHALLKRLKAIETELGRKNSFRYGPRKIDLDILSYENFHCQDEELCLPHPALGTRPYLETLLRDLNTSSKTLKMF